MIGNQREFAAVEADEIDDQGIELDLQVFPNPATDRVSVRIDEEGYRARLLSAAGKVVAERDLRVGTNHIDATALPAGLYLLAVEGADHREVRKVVIRR